jgi:hypothetical protein
MAIDNIAKAQELCERVEATLERAAAIEKEAIALKAHWQWHINQLERAGLIYDYYGPKSLLN